MENFLTRGVRIQVTRFAGKEFSGLVDRLSIHPPILIETFDPRLLREMLRWFENALLDQMRFDVVVHEQSLICRRDLFGKRFRLAVKAVATATSNAVRFTLAAASAATRTTAGRVVFWFSNCRCQ